MRELVDFVPGQASGLPAQERPPHGITGALCHSLGDLEHGIVLVEHLVERLSGENKIFRDSAISNLTEFFTRFQQLNVRSNEQLDSLVQRAQRLIQDIEPQALRDNQQLRQHVATQFSQVQSVIDGMLVDQPRRRIIRNNQETA